LPGKPEKELNMRSIAARGALASVTLGLSVMSVVALSAAGQEPKLKETQSFMREKLKHARSLIEGLANEYFGMIRDNSRSLRKVAEDAQWRISPNLTYIKYSAEFVSIADELERRANEKDLNGATLSLIRLTIN
jgi:hypothetical protein